MRMWWTLSLSWVCSLGKTHYRLGNYFCFGYGLWKNGLLWRYLRNLVSLGYDTLEMNPLTDKDAVDYLNAWDAEMKTALANNELRVLKETSEVMWLTTQKKSLNANNMRETALKNVMKYVYKNGITTIDDFKSKFNNKTWQEVLDEINAATGH